LLPWEDLLVGAVAGIVKICIAMPLLTWKFKMQAGAALPTTMAEWYRGLPVQALAVMPIAALQMVANGAFAKLISRTPLWSDTLRRPLTPIERMAAALGAGVLSAIIYTPVDLLTLQQQQLGTGLFGAAAFILQHCGPLGFLRGAGSMAVREGIFVLGMLGFTPIIAEWLSRRFERLRSNAVASTLLASVSAGVVSALLTHPMDTIKTQVQVDLFGETYTNMLTTTVLLVKQFGWGYLFLGAVPRTLMICLTFFITTTLRQLYMNMKMRSSEVRST